MFRSVKGCRAIEQEMKIRDRTENFSFRPKRKRIEEAFPGPHIPKLPMTYKVYSKRDLGKRGRNRERETES
jgi:hypothetical protein